MKAIRCVLALAAAAFATQAMAEVTFFEHDNFRGRSFTVRDRVGNFERAGFNDRASSAIVRSERWEVCEDRRFEGRCVVLRPGRYRSLSAMGLNDRVSSVRAISREARIEERRYAPPPPPYRDYRRRKNERLHEARVVAARAVVGPPEQRCWVERERVADRGDYNVPGAVAGAVIGGILGHQLGSGRGNDAATAGGAIVGGVVGANVGRDDSGGLAYTQDVRRCEQVPSSGRPEYWDVVYEFRGREHRVQMSHPPGRTVLVNNRGEPRE